MIPNWTRDADAAGRAFGLKASSHVHNVSMQVSSIGYRVTDTYADTKTNSSVQWLIAITNRNLLLYPDRAAHCSINAIEDNEEGIATRLNDLTAMRLDRRVHQIAAETPEPFQCSYII